jgi:ADP-heptose:LPS heptosyltransferase
VNALGKAERGRTFLRKLDRWIGVPSLWIWSLFRPKKAKPAQIQHIGLCVFAAIGDALLASSLIADLKKAYPDSKITIFATAANKAAFDLIEGYDQLVSVPITNPWRAIAVVRQHPVDLLIDTSQWSRIGAVVAAFSGARWTIGFETEGQSRHFAYDAYAKHSPKVHELTNFAALLGPLGIPTYLTPPIAKSRLMAIECLNIRQPYVVLHPWASGNRFELREWPTDRWVDLAKRIIQAGYGLVITGGPGDTDRANLLCKQIGSSQNPSLLNLAGKTSLLETASYLQSAAVVISVNTGTMHLAALLGVPLVALHGPTNPLRWGPIYPGSTNGDRSLILGPGIGKGGAYLNLGFEYPSNPIYLMDQISTDDVIGALRKFSMNVA